MTERRAYGHLIKRRIGKAKDCGLLRGIFPLGSKHIHFRELTLGLPLPMCLQFPLFVLAAAVLVAG
jgi:hypothetical protein